MAVFIERARIGHIADRVNTTHLRQTPQPLHTFKQHHRILSRAHQTPTPANRSLNRNKRSIKMNRHTNTRNTNTRSTINMREGILVRGAILLRGSTNTRGAINMRGSSSALGRLISHGTICCDNRLEGQRKHLQRSWEASTRFVARNHQHRYDRSTNTFTNQVPATRRRQPTPYNPHNPKANICSICGEDRRSKPRRPLPGDSAHLLQCRSSEGTHSTGGGDRCCGGVLQHHGLARVRPSDVVDPASGDKR